MSTVGRIFIVLNLVLTFVLVGFVGSILYSSNHYRQAYEGLRGQGEDQLNQLTQERDNLKNLESAKTAEIESLRKQLADGDTKYNEIYSAYVAERASMKALQDAFEGFSTKVDGWNSIYEKLTAKVEEYNGEIEKLQQLQTQAAESQRVARNREVAAAAFRIRADQHSQSLREQVRALQDQKDGLDAELQVYHLAFGPIKAAPQDLVGRVVSVSEDGRLMTVELSGLATTDPQLGWRMALSSESQFKGFVVITEVHGTGSVTARLLRPAEGAAAPVAGDRVRPVLLGRG